MAPDRKSTRLNSSHVKISYAVFCLILRLPQSTPFPYTTLFRSSSAKAPPARWDYLRTSSEAISAAHCAVSPLSAQYAPLRVACCASHRPPAPGEPAQRDHQDGADDADEDRDREIDLLLRLAPRGAHLRGPCAQHLPQKEDQRDDGREEGDELEEHGA